MITCGLVLAAGRSERFGASDKLLATFRGKPLAAYAAGAMTNATLDHRLVVAANSEVARLFDGFDVLMTGHARRAQPQSANLTLGARRAIELGADRLLVTLADMPLVGPDLLNTVLGQATDTCPAAATDGTRIMPPACFPSSWFGALAEISGDRGAECLLRDLPMDARVPVSKHLLADVDVPGDLRTLQTSQAASE